MPLIVPVALPAMTGVAIARPVVRRGRPAWCQSPLPPRPRPMSPSTTDNSVETGARRAPPRPLAERHAEDREEPHQDQPDGAIPSRGSSATRQPGTRHRPASRRWPQEDLPCRGRLRTAARQRARLRLARRAITWSVALVPTLVRRWWSGVPWRAQGGWPPDAVLTSVIPCDVRSGPRPVPRVADRRGANRAAGAGQPPGRAMPQPPTRDHCDWGPVRWCPPGTSAVSWRPSDALVPPPARSVVCCLVNEVPPRRGPPGRGHTEPVPGCHRAPDLRLAGAAARAAAPLHMGDGRSRCAARSAIDHAGSCGAGAPRGTGLRHSPRAKTSATAAKARCSAVQTARTTGN